MKFTLPEVKSFQCRFVSAHVEIQGQPYVVVPLDIGTGFRVIKSGVSDTGYRVTHKVDSGINVCDCPDYTHRHQGNGYGMCKHARALVELGFLSRPQIPKKR